jgi:hypothetical protein
MAEMVGSAVVQEIVSGGFSLMRNNHEEMASQSHLIERLKWAHLELKFALERTQRMPIYDRCVFAANEDNDQACL